MDREDSAIVHHRLERHSNVTFKSEIDRYKSMRNLVEAGGFGIFCGIGNTRLLTFCDARNAGNGKIAADWERI
jgi:hypothetical protein